MSDQHPTPDPLTQLGYEPRDVSTGPLLKWAIALAVFIVASLMVSLGIYSLTMPPPEKMRQKTGPINAVQPMPDAPILQVNPALDMRKFRIEEDRTLHSYGWVDQARGIAHIPVERAMELIAEKGLPTRQSTTPAPEGGIQ
ncbi:MAG: hypothetical protein HRF45_09245 [Fimbriimonadia bacterium]|jgi:hypothetical protein